MDILFIHQNMPGQFGRLAHHFAVEGHRVVFMTRRSDRDIPGVRRITYTPRRRPGEGVHHYLQSLEQGILNGQEVQRACLDLRREGFDPALVVAHPGWGESLFVKEVFARPQIAYAEYYYSAHGADADFDPAEPPPLDRRNLLRVRNAAMLLALEAADHAWSPTEWQRSRFPDFLQPRIETIFDGIDSDMVKPDPSARLALPDGRVLTRNDEVITYAARNLEPYRGFPVFMRALKQVLVARPQAQVVIAGGDEVSYGKPPEGGGTWREHMMAETGLPADRVHFLGHQPYDAYLRVLQVSALHVYLTYPFVLSWSFMEALAAGCRILASDTPPVREMVSDGENGWLTDFFDHDALAGRMTGLLASGDDEGMRTAARASILGRYDAVTCLTRQLDMFERVSGRRWIS